MGAWIEVGSLSRDFTSDLRRHGEKVLTSMGKHGFLSGIVLMEPSPGFWGHTPEEYRGSALDALEMQLDVCENPQGIVLGPEGEQPAAARPIKEFRSQATKIREAIEKRSLRFILGTMPNGCRSVGILVIEP